MGPRPEIVIRPAHADEHPNIQALVQTIADETFSYLFAPPVPFGEPNWQAAWVALSGDTIVGVTMTQDEWVTDLWVGRDHRRSGVGSMLIAHG